MHETVPPPHDIDAEQAVLGAVLVNNERFFDIAEQVGEADFYRLEHRRLFALMRLLTEQRRPIDHVTVGASLDEKSYDDIGGPGYLVRLMDGVPRSVNAAHYAAIVREKALRRRVMDVAHAVLRDAERADLEANAVLERAESAIYTVAEREQRGDLMPAGDVVAETWPMLEKILDTHKAVTGVPSGFCDLDRLTRGFQSGNLVLLAARPAMGKTALALNIAHYASLHGDSTTAVFSLEMSRAELMIRLLTAAGRIDGHRLMSGYISQSGFDALIEARTGIEQSRLWIDDTSSLTVSEIRGKCRRLRQKLGLGLVIIDYLQLLSSDRRFDSRVLEIGAMSRSLKQLAKELDVPILALSQLSRAPETRGGDGKPKLSDLRESGSLEQDADVVLMLYRPEEYQPTPENAGTAELIIAKHRNGPTSMVRLTWNKEQTRFDNAAQ